jgi:hypothetical protein
MNSMFMDHDHFNAMHVHTVVHTHTMQSHAVHAMDPIP